MNLDYKRFRAAVLVAEDRSFSKAAERLHVTQPALSSQIRNLEKDLGFRLFDRSTRHVALTEKGRRILREAQRLVLEYERLERFVKSLQRETSNRVTIGTAIYTNEFPERIGFFEGLFAACPDLDVAVATLGSQTEVAGLLAAGRLDVAILMGLPVTSQQYRRAVAQGDGRESLVDKGLRTLVLGSHSVDLLIPAESPLAKRPVIAEEDLARQKVAIFGDVHGEQLCAPIVRCLEKAGAELVLPPEPNATGVEQYSRQFRMLAISLGWFPQPRDNDMVRKELKGLNMHTQLVLVSHPEVSRPAVERVFEFAEEIVETPIVTSG